ncbi:DUF2173 family protein [Beggiatoa alba]|nr:DUF2173 family protein [Beggiatoa alba]
MNIYTELASLPGVIAAGEYTYRGDRYHYDGQISDEQARMASIMCRATTLAVHMQANIMKSLKADCGCAPVQGWMVRGEQFSVCVFANVFCFVDNTTASINSVMQFLKENVGEQTGELV